MSENQIISSSEENVVVCKNIVKDYPLYSSAASKIKGLLLKKSETKTFRALDDISITMKKGECMGLIGLNGSGKSTLASIITGITTPTSGTVDVKVCFVQDRVCALSFRALIISDSNVFLWDIQTNR